MSGKGKKVYIWNLIWPSHGEMVLGGFMTPLKSAKYVKDGKPIEFEQISHRIILKNLPKTSPDIHAGIAVLELEFEELPNFKRTSYYPQMNNGIDYAGDYKI